MELIDELEVTRRGPYSGGFGSISFNGDMDIALALRTIVFPTGARFDTMFSYKDVNKRQEWVAHLQSGAGIVADSVPDDEQKECENKAAALARAIDVAESSFVDKWTKFSQLKDLKSSKCSLKVWEETCVLIISVFGRVEVDRENLSP